MNKAYEVDEIVQNIFLPIYPLIANQIKRETKIDKGVCLDIGCGGGQLGFALMKITNLDVIFLDNNKDALDITNKRSEELGIEYSANTILGDAQDIPLDNECINLVISSSPLWFREDKRKSLKEIYRILRADGVAYIGCGFGDEKTKNQVHEKMMEIDGEDWSKKIKQFTEGNNVEFYNEVLKEIGIKNFNIKDDEEGLWIIIRKNMAA